jgi:hypothetical protein
MPFSLPAAGMANGQLTLKGAWEAFVIYLSTILLIWIAMAVPTRMIRC